MIEAAATKEGREWEPAAAATGEKPGRQGIA